MVTMTLLRAPLPATVKMVPVKTGPVKTVAVKLPESECALAVVGLWIGRCGRWGC